MVLAHFAPFHASAFTVAVLSVRANPISASGRRTHTLADDGGPMNNVAVSQVFRYGRNEMSHMDATCSRRSAAIVHSLEHHSVWCRDVTGKVSCIWFSLVHTPPSSTGDVAHLIPGNGPIRRRQHFTTEPSAVRESSCMERIPKRPPKTVLVERWNGRLRIEPRDGSAQ